MKMYRNGDGIPGSVYHETKKHTDTMFAYNVYPCTIPADFTFVPLHWQDSVEIIYVKRGRGIVQVNYEIFRAQQGDIFLVMPGHLHGLRGIPGERMEYENIIFDLSFLGGGNIDICSQKYLQPMAGGKIKLPVHVGRDNPLHMEVSAYLDAADRLCAARPTGYELGVKGRLLLLFSVLFQHALEQEDREAEREHVQKLKKVLARIERDYDKKLTIRDMADECGYSESHFMRWFKEATGSGFSGYLIQYRLEKAAFALRNSSDKVLQIAQQSGFDNLSNFNRLFKKKFGVSPSRFRQE